MGDRLPERGGRPVENGGGVVGRTGDGRELELVYETGVGDLNDHSLGGGGQRPTFMSVAAWSL